MTLVKANKVASPLTVLGAGGVLADWSPDDLLEGWKPREGHLLTQVRAISARVNQNFDGFSSDELKKSYRSFLGKPVFVNHHNEDPTLARGVVVGARYVESGDDKYVEVLQDVDAKAYPKLAAEIISGGLDSVSMGTEAQRTSCSICANVATDMTEMCDHVLFHKGEKLAHPETGEQTLVYESCHDLGFFELSYVFDPADETAVVSKVVTAATQGLEKTAYGEVEAPPSFDTLEDDEEEDAGYQHYVEPPKELRDPDLDEAKRLERIGDDDIGGTPEAPLTDQIAQMVEEAVMDKARQIIEQDVAEALGIGVGVPREETTPAIPGEGPGDADLHQIDGSGVLAPAQTLSNRGSTRDNKRKHTFVRSEDMARQNLATRGTNARRRRAEVENDQGVNDDSGEFVTETPAAEKATGSNEGERQPDSREDTEIPNPPRTDPQQASRKAANQEFAKFASWVQNTYGVTVRRAANDNKLRTLVQKYASDSGANVSLLMPGMKAALREASNRGRKPQATAPKARQKKADYDAEEAAIEQALAEEAAQAEAEGQGQSVPMSEEEAIAMAIAEEEARAAEEAALAQAMADEEAGAVLIAKRAAAKGYRAAMKKMAESTPDHAEADDQVDVERPVKDTNPEKSQDSQYETGEFANNAGDDLADPELGTDHIWAPGEHKRSAQVKRASSMQAVRLAEAYIEAGIASPDSRWKLAGEFEQMSRSVVMDRTALLDKVAEVQERKRKVAGGVSRQATRSPMPRNMGGAAPAPTQRVASTNDPSRDVELFF